MTSTISAAAYDAFTGPEVDPSKWMYLEYPIPDSDPWVCREPESRTTVADGRVTVEADVFSLEHGVQIIDNCKYVLLSTESFPVPADRTLVVTGRLSARSHGPTRHSWKDGFASLVVIDLATGLVFDVFASSDTVGAIHERLPFTADSQPFTHVVEAPLSGATAAEESTYDCAIALDAASGTATWTVDGHEVFRAQGIDIPAAVNLGMGIFTLQPVTDGRSHSVNGQGLTASWADLTVTTA